MHNLSMQDALRSGEALSVLAEGSTLGNGMYLLRRFVDGKDYCDPSIERWIFSIGRQFKDNKIIAATDMRFVGDMNYDCLFSR